MNFTAYDIVTEFENTIADYCGASYGVAVSSCCNAIFLVAKWAKQSALPFKSVILPKKTYPGVACSLINADWDIEFKELVWLGDYKIDPLMIVDSALRFKKGMHRVGFHTCLSFHAKKHIPIGRGGMILTDNKDLADWCRKARFDGRNQCPLEEQKDIEVCGYNMYLTPEQAARGLMLFDSVKDKKLKDIDPRTQNYPDLSGFTAFK